MCIYPLGIKYFAFLGCCILKHYLQEHSFQVLAANALIDCDIGS